MRIRRMMNIQLVCFQTVSLIFMLIYFIYGRKNEGILYTLFTVTFWLAAVVIIEEALFVISSLIMKSEFFLINQLIAVIVLVVVDVKVVRGLTWVWVIALPIIAFILYSYLYGYVFIKRMESDIEVMKNKENQLNRNIEKCHELFGNTMKQIEEYNKEVSRLLKFKNGHVEDKTFVNYFKNLKTYSLENMEKRAFVKERKTLRFITPMYDEDICGIGKISKARYEYTIFLKKSKWFENGVNCYNDLLTEDEKYSNGIYDVFKCEKDVLKIYADEIEKAINFFELDDEQQRKHCTKILQQKVKNLNEYDEKMNKKVNKLFNLWDKSWGRAETFKYLRI